MSEGEKSDKKIYTFLAHAVTYATTPAIVGGFLLFYTLYIFSPNEKLFLETFGAICFFSIIMPVLFTFYLMRKEKVGNFHMKEREERTIPFAFAMAVSAISLLAVKLLGTNHEFFRIVLTFYLMGLGYVIINILRFKLSGHIFVFTASLLILTFFVDVRFVFLAPLIILIGWSRGRLKEHTFGEVAGSLAYSLVSFIIFSFLFQ